MAQLAAINAAVSVGSGHISFTFAAYNDNVENYITELF